MAAPPGFHTFSNPSYVEMDVRGLATPDAMRILEQAEFPGADGPARAMRIMVDAYLRTGPQKLSPEPSRDYCIAAPLPGAVNAAGRRAPTAPACPEQQEAMGQGTPSQSPANEESSPSTEEMAQEEDPPAVLESERAMSTAASTGGSEDAEPCANDLEDCDKDSGTGNDSRDALVSVCSNIVGGPQSPAAEDIMEERLDGGDARLPVSVCLLDPVDSAGHVVREGQLSGVSISLMPVGDPRGRSQRKISPIAFELPVSDDSSPDHTQGKSVRGKKEPLICPWRPLFASSGSQL